MKIVILGGYGRFGGRLARLLAGDSALTLIVAGRSRARAEAFIASFDSAARRIAAAFDRDGDADAQLAALAPDLLVDASGPFQHYGASPYRIVEACIARGIDYMDLADGTGFVAGIARFDPAARKRGVFILSGASSFPVLTVAATRVLGRGLDAVETVTAGIAPSPHAGIGLSVVRAIASYAGKPIALRREGQNGKAHALIDARRFTIAPPGRLPLRNIRFTLVDVPELEVLPALLPGLRGVWAGAGPVPAVFHYGLSALAWLVRLRLLPSLSPFARLFHWAINRLGWGEHRGGMFVAVTGRDRDGGKIERTWHLIADGDDGPFIPAMACAAVIRRLARGMRPAAGARPAVDDVTLDDYRPLFAARAIATGIRERRADDAAMPLFRRVLGEAWTRLPAPVRALHDRTADWQARGEARVERGTRLSARLVAWLFGFPRAADAVPLVVSFRVGGGGETWRRRFGERGFESRLSEGAGRDEALLRERFGPFTIAIALVSESGKLNYVVRGWRVLGLPLPRGWAPNGRTFEHDDGGRFGFHVEIGHRLTGPILRYRGWLVPED